MVPYTNTAKNSSIFNLLMYTISITYANIPRYLQHKIKYQGVINRTRQQDTYCTTSITYANIPRYLSNFKQKTKLT